MHLKRNWLCWLLGTAAGLCWSGAALAELHFNMTKGVTPVSLEVYHLHMLILWICVVISLAVYAVMFYSIYAHRKSRGATPAKFHENPTLEVVWTVIPAIVLVFMAWPATKAMIDVYDYGEPDLTVKVTGYQWKWRYDYLDQGFGFFSNLKTPSEQIFGNEAKGEHYLREVDNPLVLPANKRVHFVITANDVLHSFWVPAFAIKQDAIPGFINEAWALVEKPGIYRGQCAELCGRNHGFMPIVVDVKPEQEFQAWVDDQKAQQAAAEAAAGQTFEKAELMAKGEKIYNSTCVACHQANGQGLPPAFPALAGSAIATGPEAAHLDIVLHGKAGTAMAAFGAQMNDVDIASVITYERNAWGNDAKLAEGSKDHIQPADVKAARAVAKAGN